MRRNFGLFFILLNLTLASHAVPLKRVSIAEFEQILAPMQGRQDDKVAKLVATFELTERASSVRLSRWENQFPGRRSHEAFLLLSDSSAFLELPASDILKNPPPDLQAERTMLNKSIEYIKSTITTLPNFYATRKTQNYQDLPGRSSSFNRTSEQTSLAGLDPANIPHEPMIDAGKSSTVVRYVNGQEVSGSKEIADPFGKPANVLTTHGEFGPILAAVLHDAVKNKIYWGHWEQGDPVTMAVFRYFVPAGQGSYEVMMPSLNERKVISPAYHGEISIDPDTGAILRITVIADFPPPDQQALSSILVEYAPVPIGGRSYICPVHGVALARIAVPDALGPANRINPVLVTRYETQLNDVAFIDYHQFRSESRVLIGNPIGSPDETSPTPPK